MIAKVEKSKAVKKPKVKNDPAHVAAARELRDRYLEYLNGEQFNAGIRADGRLLPSGKYDVSRQIESKRANAPLPLEQEAA